RKELDFNGVYMLKNGMVTRVITDIPNTNGLAFSPDEKYLYANGSRDKFVKRYEVQPDGTLANGMMFIDISEDTTPGITDGMRVDSKEISTRRRPEESGLFRRRASTWARFSRPSSPPTSNLATPIARLSISRRGRASIRFAETRRGFLSGFGQMQNLTSRGSYWFYFLSLRMRLQF